MVIIILFKEKEELINLNREIKTIKINKKNFIIQQLVIH